MSKPKPFSARVHKHDRAFEVRVHGAGGVRVGDTIGLLATMQDPASKETETFLLPGPFFVLAVDQVPRAAGHVRDLTMLVLPQNALGLALAAEFGQVRALMMNPREKANPLLSGQAPPRVAGVASLHDKEALTAWRTIRQKLVTAEQAQSGLEPASPPGRPCEMVPSGLRGLQLQVDGARRVLAGDQVDLIVTLVHPRTGQQLAITLVGAVPVVATDGQGCLTLLVLPAEAEVLSLAAALGTLHASLRRPGGETPQDRVLEKPYTWTSPERLIHGTPRPPCQRFRVDWAAGTAIRRPNPDCHYDRDAPPPLDAPEDQPAP